MFNFRLSTTSVDSDDVDAMLFTATVLLPLQSRGPHGPTTGDCIREPPENERRRGLHVSSVSSRTSNTHQRTAPRRYVQKWRSSCSTVRRRRRSPSPTFSNVVTSRSSIDLVEPRGASPWKSQRKYISIPCVPTSCLRVIT